MACFVQMLLSETKTSTLTMLPVSKATILSVLISVVASTSIEDKNLRNAVIGISAGIVIGTIIMQKET